MSEPVERTLHTTEAQLSEAQTAVAVATRGRDMALLNRVTALITPLQIRVYDLEDAVTALGREVAALRVEVDAIAALLRDPGA